MQGRVTHIRATIALVCMFELQMDALQCKGVLRTAVQSVHCHAWPHCEHMRWNANAVLRTSLEQVH